MRRTLVVADNVTAVTWADTSTAIACVTITVVSGASQKFTLLKRNVQTVYMPWSMSYDHMRQLRCNDCLLWPLQLANWHCYDAYINSCILCCASTHTHAKLPRFAMNDRCVSKPTAATDGKLCTA